MKHVFSSLRLLALLALLPLATRAANPVLTIQALGSLAAPGNEVTMFVDQVEIVRVSGGTVVAGTLLNPSFETNSLGASDYRYTPTGALWTFNRVSGIAKNGSGFGAATAPDGTAVAFLQSDGNGDDGLLQQTLSLGAGSYRVRFRMSQRDRGINRDQRLSVRIDGVEVGVATTANLTGYDTFTSSEFLVPTPVLTIQALGSLTVPGDDVTMFVDEVEIVRVSDGTVVAGTPLNPSFETNSLGASDYRYTPTGALWTFNGRSGIARNGSAFGAATAPDGTAVAFVQSDGGEHGLLKQTLSLGAGSYRVRFRMSQRDQGTNQDQRLSVQIDGVEVGVATTANLTGYDTFTSSEFLVPLTLTALSPPAELPGMPVVLTGTGFTAGSTVSFGGVAAGSVTVTSSTSLIAVVPAGAAAGSHPVVVTTTAGSSGSAPFTVLGVYSGGGLDACASAVPATNSSNDGAWHYLLSSPGGQVVAAYNYTGPTLGDLVLNVLRASPGAAVRQDAGARPYLDRNFHLTASSGSFPGRTVALRLYGLNTELTRLQAVAPGVTLANLKATQYSGANEDCQLSNNSAAGQRRTLAAPATSPTDAPWFAAELSVADHFSEFYLTGSSTPLPVELTQFTATAEGPAAVRLVWATASERNSDRFEVERSGDGRTFERIGTVAAAGSSSTPRRYELLDNRLLAGAALPYYRLRQVDADATFSYSPVRAVAVSGPAGLTLFPNPTTGAATLTGTGPGTLMRVYDALGRQVLAATADATGTTALKLPAGLPAGVYVVRAGTKALRLTVE